MTGIKMRKSFTLIEILVSVAIFSIVIGVALDLFAFSLKAQRENLSNQYLLDQANYALEYISRQLRMAKKDENGSCITSGCTYEALLDGIAFLNHNKECEQILLEDGQIKIIKGNGPSTPITSNDFEITEFNVWIMEECNGYNTQPRATISFKIKRRDSLKEPLIFQTTISNRNLDI